MTLQPQTIEAKDNLENARKLMTRFGIRHLPVVDNGIVIGILSEREVNLANGIESMDLKQILVIDVCSERPYIVHPETPLRDAVGVMAQKHFGSAIVMENAKLVGIFTTVDACRALHDLLQEATEGRNREQLRSLHLFFRDRQPRRASK
jgi:acetoin utilization protein AcuB